MRALLLLFAFCLPLSLPAAEKPRVVTSFSILADMTRAVGGEHIQLNNLVGPDSDAHTYETTPDDARAVRQAQLVVENGLGFEPWLDRLVKSTETRAQVIQASHGVIPRSLEEDGQTIPDPHAWNNLANADIYVDNIAKALEKLDPANAADYRRNAEAYLKQAHALLAYAKDKLGNLPADRRTLVTSHDAFGYLGQAYGLKLLAPQGLSTEREASATEVAELIRQIREQHIRAVFVENIKDPRLMQRIAEESGAKIGGTLHSDALASEGPASTYLGLYRSNVDTLYQALAD
ncbi:MULTISPECIES: metal ABC transporter substrate-binding protein [Pseudomonas]|jgi:zinc/manganese transport system substrate-binding protein|uniref:metal ABC transporter substrate-binding protein n=1 Tax=Pseudomonas TaxID=286 RepID=UPI0004D344E8|nr:MULTISPECIES: metal ABC transporter substrate-binding protein [Pseudomonas]KSW24962.1 metal ABC transporter substrate-binding protein [Pseudomonas sp. ADP]AMO73616.1 putative periplasmic iron-binding protein precursor [Pseudomonas citronellolis]KES23288.1 metal ABC transporter substrate-binding protein [Pseudomonas sp. AAC]MBH3434799.1 metal ABC transporter substrate-binding protein [Pseudomonas citronellolis]OBP08342.1 metal ABC transporter substrate-binding protein [Pseudomonas sp. EGD-AK